jgi:hypothetical protein
MPRSARGGEQRKAWQKADVDALSATRGDQAPRRAEEAMKKRTYLAGLIGGLVLAFYSIWTISGQTPPGLAVSNAANIPASALSAIPVPERYARWEKAAQMANHASTRTTQLYDRRGEEVTLDEVERILV